MSMKLGVVVSTPEVGDYPLGLLAGTFEEKVRKAAEFGYDGLELLFRDPEIVDCGRINQLVRDFHLEIPALVTGGVVALERLSLMSPDDSVAQRAMDRLKSLLRFAGEYGAVVDIGWLRGRLSDMPDRERALEQLRKALLAAAQYAASVGARITLEPINRYELDLIHNAQDGLEWVDRVGHPSFGLMLDTFHMNIEDVSIEDSIREARRCLWHIHVADSNRLSPGKGHFDFRSMIATLQQLGYSGYLSAEHLPYPDGDAAARETSTYLRALLGRRRAATSQS
jgi:sugar phosphate isomerase/epimerase